MRVNKKVTGWVNSACVNLLFTTLLVTVPWVSRAIAQTPTCTDPAGCWVTKANMPTARDALAVGVLNNKIYALGGRAGNSSWITTVEEYDPAMDTWTSRASMPTSRSYLGVGAVGNKIYAIGGLLGYIATVEEYDPATNTWTNCGIPAPGNGCAQMPTGRHSLAIAVVNNKIYAIGGQSGAGALSTVEEYDPATNTWTNCGGTCASMPTARWHLAAGLVNGKIYVIGGNAGSFPYALTTIEEYDPATNTWTNCGTPAPGNGCAQMPTGRIGFAGVVNNKIYAVGGYYVTAPLSTVEEYDPATNTWTTKASMPTARSNLGVGVVNGTMYAIGGSNNGGYLNTVETYTTPAPTIGLLYWTDDGTEKIQRANPDGSGVADIVMSLNQLRAIALDLAGGKMYWADRGTKKILRANLDGSGVEDLVTAGIIIVPYIALDPEGGKIYWPDPYARKIQRANLDGSNVEDLITTGLSFPIGVAFGTIGPSTGPSSGGQTVGIVGTNFVAGGTVVTFGGSEATSVDVKNSNYLTAITPVGQAGVVDVAVTTPHGSAVLAGGYTYLAVDHLPTANAGGPYMVAEGGRLVTLTGSGSNPDGDPLTYSWDLDNNGTFETSGQNPTFSAAGRDGPTSQTVVLKVCDSHDACATSTATVNITNVAPTANFVATSPINEGGSSNLSLSNPTDASSADVAAGFRYSFACDGQDSSLAASYATAGIANSINCTFTDNGSFTVKGRIFDKDNGFTPYGATVVVNNIAPTVGTISAPLAPVQVNTPITGSAPFTDLGTSDTHTAVWSWGDGTTSAGTVTETNGSGSVTGSHVYAAAGVYTVTLTVTDDDGGSGQSVFQFVVVFDPSAGFVTGGGWINSLGGAYVADPSLTGKANFGFVSRYRPGATVPEGQTEFRFSVANLNFHSSNYEWLVVGGARAQYKGTGTINGTGSYSFILTAIDGQVAGGGGVDKFRIKIWGSGVIYDNQTGASDTADPTTQLGGGSIVIHTQ